MGSAEKKPNIAGIVAFIALISVDCAFVVNNRWKRPQAANTGDSQI